LTKAKPKVEKVCVRCETKYYSSYPKTKYCGYDCYYKATLLNENIKKNCVVCNSEFYSTNTQKVNCSNECARVRIKTLANKRRQKFLKEQEKNCKYCNTLFLSIGSYNIYCGKKCVSDHHNLKQRLGNLKNRSCVICSKNFESSWKRDVCFSSDCKRTRDLKRNYALLNGNWLKYLQSLCRKRKDPKLQKHFDGKFLLNLIEKQNYKCSISGEPLTCIAEMNTDLNLIRRVHHSNASIDRIKAGEPYTKENVQLVCLAVNIARSNLEIDDYINWCEKVANYQKYRKAQE
jgi:hypothetical protein